MIDWSKLTASNLVGKGRPGDSCTSRTCAERALRPQSKSAIAEFMRSSMKKARETNENYEEGLLKLVRTLPTVGRGLWLLSRLYNWL